MGLANRKNVVVSTIWAQMAGVGRMNVQPSTSSEPMEGASRKPAKSRLTSAQMESARWTNVRRVPALVLMDAVSKTAAQISIMSVNRVNASRKTVEMVKHVDQKEGAASSPRCALREVAAKIKIKKVNAAARRRSHGVVHSRCLSAAIRRLCSEVPMTIRIICFNATETKSLATPQ